MKKIPLIMLLVAITIFSCKKESPGNGLSDKINNIIADSVIKAFESRGLVINRGNNPPKVEGVFLASPFELHSPFGPADPYLKGRIIENYLYKIYDQVGDEAKVDYKNSVSDNAIGLGSFISGSGNKFTLFAKNTGTNNGINYRVVSIITGELTSAGIKDMQHAFVLTEKDGDDGNSILMPEGKGRIWFDNDKLSTVKSSYDFSATKNNSSQLGIMGCR